jgi:hypothetical protein
MTSDFAAQYRASAVKVRDQVVSSRTSMTTRVTTPGDPPAYDARRALVTMVHTDRGWLVGNVQTR